LHQDLKYDFGAARRRAYVKIVGSEVEPEAVVEACKCAAGAAKRTCRKAAGEAEKSRHEDNITSVRQKEGERAVLTGDLKDVVLIGSPITVVASGNHVLSLATMTFTNDDTGKRATMPLHFGRGVWAMRGCDNERKLFAVLWAELSSKFDCKDEIVQ